MPRRFCYVSGTRADFGLMRSTLAAIAAHPDLAIEIVATGMHLSDRFGHTIDDIRDSGLPIVAEIPVDIDLDSEIGMALCAGQFADQFARHLSSHEYDGIVLLGDRWEMLAAAMAGMLAGLPIAHFCGGERSGTVDDALRHAISKIAHLHLVATTDSRDRLVRMGEEEARIRVVGTPGLVGLADFRSASRKEVAARYGFDRERPIALMLFHPVVQDAPDAGRQSAVILDALGERGYQTVGLLPNADTGNDAIRRTLLAREREGATIKPIAHLDRRDFWDLMANADVMIGNSSAGIIEAASFGIPVVNVGDRQQDRLRNENVIDCDLEVPAVLAAIDAAAMRGRRVTENVYGCGKTDSKVAAILAEMDWDDPSLLRKSMRY